MIDTLRTIFWYRVVTFSLILSVYASREVLQALRISDSERAPTRIMVCEEACQDGAPIPITGPACHRPRIHPGHQEPPRGAPRRQLSDQAHGLYYK